MWVRRREWVVEVAGRVARWGRFACQGNRILRLRSWVDGWGRKRQ